MAKLMSACEGEDVVTVGHVAHSLKSAARSVGAMRLGLLCEKLEHAGKAGDAAACLALSKALSGVFDDAANAIRCRMENL